MTVSEWHYLEGQIDLARADKNKFYKNARISGGIALGSLLAWGIAADIGIGLASQYPGNSLNAFEGVALILPLTLGLPTSGIASVLMVSNGITGYSKSQQVTSLVQRQQSLR